jgi:hypothetical protein
MSETTDLVESYLSIQQAIKALEAEATVIKDKIAEHYRPGSDPLKEGNTVLCWVMGRRSEKVDTKELRKQLVISGVDINLVERGFAKATVTVEGKPYLRIARENDYNAV